MRVLKVALPADGVLQTYNGTAWVSVATGSVVSKAIIDAGSKPGRERRDCKAIVRAAGGITAASRG